MNPTTITLSRALKLALAAFVLVALFVTAAPAFADSARPAAVAQAGGDTTISFSIENQTSVAQSYELTATGLPTDVGTTFLLSDGSASARLQVPANATGVVSARFQVPGDVAPGAYVADLTARRSDGTAVSLPFELDVQNRFALKITSIPANLATFSGQDFSFDVTVANTGGADLTGLTPVVDAPQKWVVRSDPATATLSPGAEATFHLTVTVPASQVAIDQPVSVTLKADQVESAPGSVAVKVQSNPVFYPIAAAVVVVAIIIVAVYFRQKGRR